MADQRSIINVREAVPSDAQEMCDLLNVIIKIGGSTAAVVPVDVTGIVAQYLESSRNINCFVAVDQAGKIAGFQSLKRHADLPDDWADIATFARVEPKVPGVGRALFAQSVAFLRVEGFVAINATIRADNSGGLVFYDKIGFETYGSKKDTVLADGTIVDRVLKKFIL